jgi:hypothetical protein
MVAAGLLAWVMEANGFPIALTILGIATILLWLSPVARGLTRRRRS